MSDYVQLLRAAKFASFFAVGLFGTAFVLAWLAFWVPGARFPAVTMLLLSTHAVTGHYAFARMAKMQAALDMKRMVIDARKEELFGITHAVLSSGHTLDLIARDNTRFVVTSSEYTELTVEYLK